MPTTAFLDQYSPEADNSSSFNEITEETTNLNTAERNSKAVFYCCLFLLGSLGNAMVILVLKRKRKRTINDYFILNLAVADLTFLWLSLPFYTYELFQPFNKNLLYCKLIWPMMSVTSSVSVFTLTSMAVERCRGITNPLQPRIKPQATLIWIFLIWIFAFFTLVPLMIVARSEGVFCAENWPKNYYHQAYTAVLFALQYGIPLFVIATAYFRIAIFLIRSRLPMLTTINSKGEVIRHKTRSENVQIIRTLAVIVILFMACMFPNPSNRLDAVWFWRCLAQEAVRRILDLRRGVHVFTRLYKPNSVRFSYSAVLSRIHPILPTHFLLLQSERRLPNWCFSQPDRRQRFASKAKSRSTSWFS